MPHLSPSPPAHLVQPPTMPSPLVLCDRLITLAQEADRAGFAVTAEHLVSLAHTMIEEPRALT